MSTVWKAAFLWHHGSMSGSTGFHYQTDLEPGESEPPGDQVADELDTKLTSGFRGCCLSAIVIDKIYVHSEELRGGDIPRSGQHLIAASGTLGGANDGRLDDQMYPIIDRYSEAATRSGRGWSAMPPILNSAAMGGDGLIAPSGFLGLALTSFEALLDDDISHTTVGVLRWKLHPVIYSKTRRTREQDPWTFRVSRAQHALRPHWLRTRRS